MSRARAWLVLVGCAVVTVAGCSSGSLATSGSTPPGSTSVSATTVAGPTVIVTVPDLLAPSAPVAASAAAAVASSAAAPASEVTEPAAPQQTTEPEQPETAAADVPDLPTDAPVPTAAEVAAPPGDAFNVSLANCDGCTVLASHRGVTGDLSAALVGTGSARAVLLSVGSDGSVAGVIGVPYGAAFTAPDGGVLACEQARCVVQGRQGDGRAILSAFELTGSGAWRDVSGDDAFPSATERAAIVELGGELGIAVQDQADGPAVWMLYRWDGVRFAVVGCAQDGAPPPSIDAVSPAACLS